MNLVILDILFEYYPLLNCEESIPKNSFKTIQIQKIQTTKHNSILYNVHENNEKRETQEKKHRTSIDSSILLVNTSI